MMTRKDYIATAEILKYLSNKVHPAVFSKTVHDFAEMFAKELQQLQDQMPAFDISQSKEALRKELGEEKYQQITYLSKPIAAASIAQVHFAKIINNEKKEIDVAIKILRPNIEKIFNKELDALRFLASVIEFSVKKSREKNVNIFFHRTIFKMF